VNLNQLRYAVTVAETGSFSRGRRVRGGGGLRRPSGRHRRPSGRDGGPPRPGRTAGWV